MLSDRVRILDGGLSSALETMGFILDGEPLWTAKILKENPSAIYKVHEKFLNSGAEILTSSSYQASKGGFETYYKLSEDESFELIKKSAHLAREAASKFKIKNDKEILVGGSVGPYGACLADGSEYSGDYISSMSFEELQNWHRPRIEALLSSGVDFLIIETIPSMKEALSILELLQNDFSGSKAWVTFSCKDGLHTNHGELFSEAVSSCFNKYHKQLIGIGVNCTPPKYITSLLEAAASSIPISAIPRIVYPNSGGWYDSGVGWSKDDTTPIFNATLIDYWIELGAKVIGGCCQVMPSDIKILSNLIFNYASKNANNVK